MGAAAKVAVHAAFAAAVAEAGPAPAAAAFRLHNFFAFPANAKIFLPVFAGVSLI